MHTNWMRQLASHYERTRKRHPDQDLVERIADSATNIAEDVYDLVEGEIIRHRAAITD